MLKKSRQIFCRHAVEIKIFCQKFYWKFFLFNPTKQTFIQFLVWLSLKKKLKSVFKNFGMKKGKKKIFVVFPNDEKVEDFSKKATAREKLCRGHTSERLRVRLPNKTDKLLAYYTARLKTNWQMIACWQGWVNIIMTTPSYCIIWYHLVSYDISKYLMASNCI